MEKEVGRRTDPINERSVCREEREQRRTGNPQEQMATSDEKTSSTDSPMSPNVMEEKSRPRRSHFFSRSLSRGSFSWSFVRNALQPANRNGALSTSSYIYDDAGQSGSNSISSSNSNISDDTSEACSTSSGSSSTSGSSSSRSLSRRSRWSFGQRRGHKFKPKERKPVLVEKIPFGKSSQYLTVYVGPRIEQSVKYVISRKLLKHPLFQVLMKCSEDEFGEDFSLNKGVAIVCDPALFLQVVRAVDDSMWNALSAVSEDTEGELALCV